MLEKMDKFFEARLSDYDEHMLEAIEGADEFYKFTASLLPREAGAQVLDLGCGTGLELREYFALNAKAQVTGIDLSQAMLDRLAQKLPGRNIRLICGSYFDTPLGDEQFDAAVSVESLHHFTAQRKLSLYTKLRLALKPSGYFILTDYFAESPALAAEYFDTLARLKREQGIDADDGEFYHYDTPLTVEHEIEVLKNAGFSEVRILKNWMATYTLMARVGS